jgi:ribosomal protein S7
MSEKILDQNMGVNKIEKNKTFVECLIAHLMRDGNKNWAFSVVVKVGISIGTKINKNYSEVYEAIFKILQPFVEIRKVRVRRTSYLVPFPTTLQRQQHLVSLWILETAKKDPRKIDFETKLYEELLKILTNKGATLEKKKEIYKKAEKSRSFLHYRWY